MDWNWKHSAALTTAVGLALFAASRRSASASPRMTERDWTREFSEYSQPTATPTPTIDPADYPNIDRELDPRAPDNVNFPTPDPNKPNPYPTGQPISYDFGTPSQPAQPMQQPPIQDYTFPTEIMRLPAQIDPGTPYTERGDAVVMDYQDKLRQLGYDPGPIDGRIGNLTRNAIRDFQRSHALVVDGVLGPRTKAAIDRAISGQSGAVSGLDDDLSERANMRRMRAGYGTGDCRHCRW